MKHFGKNALASLLVIILGGAVIGCFEASAARGAKPTLQSLAIAVPPTKTIYTRNEALNLSGLVVTGTYSDNTTKTEIVSAAHVSGYNADATGQQTLTVTVSGKTATLSVTVNAPASLKYEEIADYIKNMQGGGAADVPVLLIIDADLANEGWASILSVINEVGKYVALDVSACTIEETEFDPGAGAGADKITALVLPDAVKSVKNGAYDADSNTYIASFRAFTSLKAVSLPAATFIGDYAFYGCASLGSVSLPAATSIGQRAFYDCTRLEAVSLPAVTSIGDYAFSGCTRLGSANLPMATSIGYRAFRNCMSLGSVSLPVATDISYGAFHNCTSLKSVSLPAATSIGGAAFDNCTSLEAVSLPAVTSIGDYAFYDCASLGAVSLPAATSIGQRAFYDCTRLGSANMPSATSIGNAAFDGCTRLGSVSLDAATSIGDYAFSGCYELESVNLPAAISIGQRAFYGTRLGSVSLPAAVSIGQRAFYGTRLVSVNLPAATAIGDYAFYGTRLGSVSLPAATSIGGAAFGGCYGLGSVSLPATPPTIGDIFYTTGYTATGSTGNITIVVPNDAVSTYTSTWDVDRKTPAGGNTGKYGFDHKAVTITNIAQ
jgi:hypothetical protein